MPFHPWKKCLIPLIFFFHGIFFFSAHYFFRGLASFFSKWKTLTYSFVEGLSLVLLILGWGLVFSTSSSEPVSSFSSLFVVSDDGLCGKTPKDGLGAVWGSFGTLDFHDCSLIHSRPVSSLASVENGLRTGPGSDILRLRDCSFLGKINSERPGFSLVFGVLFFKNSTSFFNRFVSTASLPSEVALNFR